MARQATSRRSRPRRRPGLEWQATSSAWHRVNVHYDWPWSPSVVRLRNRHVLHHPLKNNPIAFIPRLGQSIQPPSPVKTINVWSASSSPAPPSPSCKGPSNRSRGLEADQLQTRNNRPLLRQNPCNLVIQHAPFIVVFAMNLHVDALTHHQQFTHALAHNVFRIHGLALAMEPSSHAPAFG